MMVVILLIINVIIDSAIISIFLQKPTCLTIIFILLFLLAFIVKRMSLI